MAKFFYWIYRFTSSHKLIAFFILSGIIALAAFSASHLRFEEDIVAIMPKDKSIKQTGDVFEGFKMNKRIVVHLTTEEAEPEGLIKLAHQVADSLQTNVGDHISEITLTIPDSQIKLLYDYYYNNLPFYLQEEDYAVIEKRIEQDDFIDNTLKQVYKSLMSPIGVVTKEMVIKDPFGLTAFPLNKTKQLQLDDNFSLYKNHLLTKNQQDLVFFVGLVNPPNETAENGELIEALERVSQQLSTDAIQIEYFGAAAIAVANASRIKNDIILTVSLALAGLLLFISFFYRNVTVFFIAITPGVFGGLVAVAILSLLKDQVSVISLAVGSVLLGITIDYALHFFTHAKKESNVAQLFEDLSIPLMLSSITTACAFFSLLFIRSTALQDLGLFAGISVISAALYTLLVLPHFVRNKEQKVRSQNWVEKFVGGLAKYPLYKKKWALISILVFTVVSFFFWKKVSFESNMLGLSYMPEKLAQYEDHINKISNYSANNIYLATTAEDIWMALEANQPVQDLLSTMKSDSVIYEFVTLNKVVPTIDQQQNRLQKWNKFWEKNSANQLVGQLNDESTKLGFNANTFQSFDSLLSVDHKSISTKELDKLMSVLGEDLAIKNQGGTVSVLSSIKLSAEAKPDVLAQLEKVPGVLILDRGYITSKLVVLLKEDFNKLVNISLVVVFIIILLGYGRLETSIIAFVPILLSWLWVLGLMGLLGLKFNIVNIIVCTFIFGLGIDYSIFVMRGLSQGYKYGVDNIISYKKSIILSVVTTLLGIGVLAFAEHPALKSIAILAIIGIVSVIVITFTVEHILYNLLIGNRKKKGVIPFTLSSLFMTIVAFSYFVFGCLLLQITRLVFLIPIGSKSLKKYIFHWIMMAFCRSLVYMMANFKKEVVDKEHADFSKPSVIIANHHSFIDILILLMFHPKVVMVTNDWVYYSPFFGKSVQYADFILASKGVENQMDKIEKLVEDGFSIIVYPEGTRTGDFKLRRFHKGAFYLAEQFKLDIQPVILHGTSLVMPKGDDFYLKNNKTTIKFLPRIKHGDERFGVGYAERTKKISKHFKLVYNKLRLETETPAFFKEVLIKNYLFKGPVLEWYVRIKFSMEKSYQLFHELVPPKAKVTDLGCGYGIMTYALAISGSNRKVRGVDYDAEKINVAQECAYKPKNISFEQGDVMTVKLEKSDVFLLSDVLHYLTDDEQLAIMKKMADHLEDEGIIIVRDGDRDKAKRHKGTELTEVFSTNLGFNKTRNKMNYISGEFMEEFAKENNFNLEVIDNTKRTSNTVFVLKRK